MFVIWLHRTAIFAQFSSSNCKTRERKNGSRLNVCTMHRTPTMIPRIFSSTWLHFHLTGSTKIARSNCPLCSNGCTYAPRLRMMIWYLSIHSNFNMAWLCYWFIHSKAMLRAAAKISNWNFIIIIVQPTTYSTLNEFRKKQKKNEERAQETWSKRIWFRLSLSVALNTEKLNCWLQQLNTVIGEVQLYTVYTHYTWWRRLDRDTYTNFRNQNTFLRETHETNEFFSSSFVLQ